MAMNIIDYMKRINIQKNLDMIILMINQVIHQLI